MEAISPPPKISDVAEVAGVSIATVSRVLNNRADVSDETRQRVQDAIQQVGYNGTPAARQKAKEAIKSIALIVHTVDNEYWGEIINGLADELNATTHQLNLHLTNAQVERETQSIQIAKQTNADGLLIVNPQCSENELIQWVGQHPPFILIDYYAEHATTPCVRATNMQGTIQAIDYLVSLGHRRIGIISGRESDKVVIARKRGYYSALHEAGIPLDADLMIDGDYHWASGFQAMTNLLNLPERPTAVLVFSDTMVFGAIEAVRMAGLHIPQDISLISFDDVPTTKQIHPPLTVVRQPLNEMGRMAAQMLMSLMDKRPLVAPQVVLPTQLIERESCRSIV